MSTEPAAAHFAAIELLNAARPHLCTITRLRLDGRLFDPPPPRRRGTVGRPPLIGRRQPSLARRLVNRKTCWRRVLVSGWYRRVGRVIEIACANAI